MKLIRPIFETLLWCQVLYDSSLSISVCIRMQLRFVLVSRQFPGVIPESPHGRVCRMLEAPSPPPALRTSTNVGCLRVLNKQKNCNRFHNRIYAVALKQQKNENLVIVRYTKSHPRTCTFISSNRLPE